MSKMSQLHASLSESAATLGFESVEDAEAHGYKADYDIGKMVPDVDTAYQDLEQESETARKGMLEKIGSIKQELKDLEEYVKGVS